MVAINVRFFASTRDLTGTTSCTIVLPPENSTVAYAIEEIIHQQLAAYLDKSAPFGEVFNYPSEDAIESIENAIEQFKPQHEC